MQKFKKHAQATVINAGLQDGLKIPKKLGGLHTDGAPSVNWNMILHISKCIHWECAVILQFQPSSLVSGVPGHLFYPLVTWKAGYNQTDTQTTEENTCKSDNINIMTLPISHFFNDLWVINHPRTVLLDFVLS